MKNLIRVNETNIDCTNIVIDENYPLEKCGCLNESGRVVVRDINAYSDAKDNHISKDGILQIIGEGFEHSII